MRLAREGVPFLLAAVLPFSFAAIVGYLGDSVTWKVIALVFGVASVFIGYFFRDPDRHSDASAGTL